MSSTNITYVVDIIILAFGIYLAYSAYKMNSNHIPPTLMVSVDELKKAKDPKGFCNAMNIPFVILAVLSVVYGIVGFTYNIFSSKAKEAVALLEQATEAKDADAIATATDYVNATAIPMSVNIFVVALLGIYLVFVVYFVIVLKKNKSKFL